MTPVAAHRLLACLLATGALAACSVHTERRVVVPPPPPPAPAQPTSVYVPSATSPPPPTEPDTVSPSRDEYGHRYDAKGNRID